MIIFFIFIFGLLLEDSIFKTFFFLFFFKIRHLQMHTFEFFWTKIALNETSENMNKQWTTRVLQNNDGILKWLNTWEINIMVYWHVG